MNLFVRKQDEKGLLTISGYCKDCGCIHKIENVSEDGYNEYKRGFKQMHDCIPEVCVDDAEFLHSQICPDCQLGYRVTKVLYNDTKELLNLRRFFDEHHFYLSIVVTQNGIDVSDERGMRIAKNVLLNSVTNN